MKFYSFSSIGTGTSRSPWRGQWQQRGAPWRNWILPPSFHATRDNHLTPSNGFFLLPWGQQPDLVLKALCDLTPACLSWCLYSPLAFQNLSGMEDAMHVLSLLPGALSLHCFHTHAHFIPQGPAHITHALGGTEACGLSTPTRPVCFIIYLHQKLNCPIRYASDDQLEWRKREGGS